MPHLVKVQEQYKAQGLVIIAAHCQNVPEEQVVGLCRQKKVNYTVTSNGRVSGDESKGIPHAYLFDASGKCVAEGHPSELTGKIADVVAQAPHWLLQGRKLESSVKAIEAGLKGGKNFAWALDQCDATLKKNDDKAKEEATFLKERLLAESEAKLAEAQAAEGNDAALSVSLYEQVKATFGKKAEASVKAEARLKELKKDKAFQEELKAAKIVAAIRELLGQMVAVDGKYNLEHPGNRSIVEQVMAGTKQLKAKHPNAKITQKCLEELKGYGFP